MADRWSSTPLPAVFSSNETVGSANVGLVLHEFILQHGFVLAMAFTAGAVDSIGGGGGLISVPALLSAGVPHGFLLGTNKSMAAMGSTAAVFRYARAGLLPRLPLKTWAWLVFLAILSGAVGAAFSQLAIILDNLRILIPVLLFSVMAFLIKRWFWDERRKKAQPLASLPPTAEDDALVTPGSQAMIASIAGYDGLFGPGTGTFFLSYLESIGFRTLNANAVTKIFNLSSNIGALSFFAWKSAVIWSLGLAAAGTYLIGNYLGSGLVLKRGHALVRVTVLLMTSLMIVKYLATYRG